MIGKQLSFEAFLRAGLPGIPKLIGQLHDEVHRRIAEIESNVRADEERSTRFIQLCEDVAAELNEHGHNLRRYDYDAEISYVHSSQTWAHDPVARGPNGLEIEFRPNGTTIHWKIESDRLLCPACSRPSGTQVGKCQYCGHTLGKERGGAA